MPTVFLNSEQHQDVRVDTRATRESGNVVSRAAILSSEFGEAHREFPILLYAESGAEKISAHAILGLDQNENLFIENDEWISTYVPASISRGPFSLGYVRGDRGDGEPVDARIMIDEDDPRLGTEGQALFLELGGESPYLEGVKTALQVIDAGLRTDSVLYPLLLEMQLLEQVDIRIRLDDRHQFNFSDYFTIDRGRLSKLSEEQLERLNQGGMLGLVYLLVSSLGNFQHLVDLKNARLKAA